ncbi:MAG: N-acetylmuramoyl-L-alanine amidase [Chloroflexota bacterium]|nr:N-acetylmuramoyl-L-alanine amidase [Chloroflexota bacterium]
MSAPSRRQLGGPGRSRAVSGRGVLVATLVLVSSLTAALAWRAAQAPAGSPLQRSVTDQLAAAVGQVEDAIAGGIADAPRVSLPGDPPGYVRVRRPDVPPGPRRVGIQAGHWKTQEAPPELGRILTQTGTSWNGLTEWEVNIDVAERVAGLLRDKGLVVDVLPTTIPPGYLADAFVALHADGDGVGDKSGYKVSHSTRRTPFEDRLVADVRAEYEAATGLDFDAAGITRNMTGYYAFAWSRVRYSAAPHTPSAILEMGFLSNDHDRGLMTAQADEVATGIANGILRFLDEVPPATLFGQDLLLPPAPAFRPASPSPSAP